eukprot:CAMPEP_0185588448 /NCGR_PEP_ID=MMETSP0434-20130131/53130_1 /TAXON_ID=626734 ORGANISM="Favella taraikaensis, Strain Fe Narragansett Bay" /NCGR_SAMPLE_ID=MMETSP0434 /ASSEMBLY_ACC=CAM_ASM_000379 /LENGTH=56 /DNA_ID=CAMNT_0028211131 /DNA_START=818 /DNA_END=988 /DNA_ORIENTATION=-
MYCYQEPDEDEDGPDADSAELAAACIIIAHSILDQCREADTRNWAFQALTKLITKS